MMLETEAACLATEGPHFEEVFAVVAIATILGMSVMKQEMNVFS